MGAVDDVDFGFRNVAAKGFRLGGIERGFILAPEDEQARLLFAQFPAPGGQKEKGPACAGPSGILGENIQQRTQAI